MGAAFWPVVVVGAFFVWIVYVAVDLEVPAFLAKWYREPGNSVRAMTWVGSLFIVLITLTSPVDSFLGNLRTDAITVAVTVIVIEELGRYRAALEEKERIIRQMASHSNEFALEAVRLIQEKGWDKDGSLCRRDFAFAQLQEVQLWEANLERTDFGLANLESADLTYSVLKGAILYETNLKAAYLTDADLQDAELQNSQLQKAKLARAKLVGVNLQAANLESAILIDANLQKANLYKTNLQDAKYTVETTWPDGFDPKAVGAILVQWNEEKEDWIPVKNTIEQQ